MRITILQVDCRGAQCRVDFTSDFGAAWGYWQGAPPEKGSAYHVEIDLPSVATMKTELADLNNLNPSIRADGTSKVVLVGTLMRDDGGDSVQLGDDVLLLDGKLSLFMSGSVIQLIAPSITLFPVTF